MEGIGPWQFTPQATLRIKLSSRTNKQEHLDLNIYRTQRRKRCINKIKQKCPPLHLSPLKKIAILPYKIPKMNACQLLSKMPVKKNLQKRYSLKTDNENNVKILSKAIFLQEQKKRNFPILKQFKIFDIKNC